MFMFEDNKCYRMPAHFGGELFDPDLWTTLTWEQHPMQWHIIKALAELPMIEMNTVTMMQGRVSLMDSRGRVLR